MTAKKGFHLGSFVSRLMVWIITKISYVYFKYILLALDL